MNPSWLFSHLLFICGWSLSDQGLSVGLSQQTALWGNKAQASKINELAPKQGMVWGAAEHLAFARRGIAPEGTEKGGPGNRLLK